MSIRIAPINQNNQIDLEKLDSNKFMVESKLIVTFESGSFSYKVTPVEGYEKTYAKVHLDLSAFDGEEKAIFLAYYDNQIAGRIILKKSWNNYAIIDIEVDQAHRRRGVGTALIKAASEWARKRNLPGLLAESQDINVGACKLYETCGFQLGGFDVNFYKNLDPPLEEIALFWYLIF
ncbi:MAG: GNAT family N-acetyltransferase [Candidatus Heimdallarchaeota archaeon]